MKRELIALPENQIDIEKLKRDISFIKSFQALAQKNNWKIVVSGGYGLDILLGKITRNHGDVDIILYGKMVRSIAQDIITGYLREIVPNPEISVHDETFFTDIDVNSPGLGANIYFVETVANPYLDTHGVKKLSGDIVTNTDDRFPLPVIGKLGDLEIEVQNPNLHLADILLKRRSNPTRPNHDQDIKNLEQITDKTIVQRILDLS